MENEHSSESEAEEIRRESLRSETTLEAVGILLWLSAFAATLVSLPAAIFGLMTAGQNANFSPSGIPLFLFGTLLFFAAVAMGSGALGMSRFKPWSRIAAIGGFTIAIVVLLLASLWSVFSGPYLAFPISVGCLLTYCISFLAGPQGQSLFSQKYLRARQMTPQIQAKSPRTLIFLVSLLFGFLTFLIAGSAMR